LRSGRFGGVDFNAAVAEETFHEPAPFYFLAHRLPLSYICRIVYILFAYDIHNRKAYMSYVIYIYAKKMKG